MRSICLFARAALFLIAVALLAHGPAQAQQPGPGPSTPLSVTVAVSTEFLPFSDAWENQAAVGMLVDMWRLWGQRTGHEVEFLLADWAGSVEAVRSGRADIHSGLIPTDDRSEFLDFSMPFYALNSVLFSPAQAPKNTLEELQGLDLGCVAGSFQARWLARRASDMELVAVSGPSEAIALMDGYELDAFMDDAFSTLHVLRVMGRENDFYVSPPLSSNCMCAAVRKGQAGLLAEVERGLDLVRQDMPALEERWVTRPQLRVLDSPFSCPTR